MYKIDLSKSQEEEAVRIHREAVVVDTHCDTLGGLIQPAQRGVAPKRLGEVSENRQVEIPKMLEGGLDCQVFAMYTGTQEAKMDALFKAVKMADTFYQDAETYSDKFVAITKVDEILQAHKAGKVSGVLSIEGAASNG